MQRTIHIPPDMTGHNLAVTQMAVVHVREKWHDPNTM